MELEEHQNSHTGEKPFECEVCKARFNRRSTLWNHKRIHSDTKPFNCPVCNMTFKWKNSLKCHKEMHLRKNETTSVEMDATGQITYASSTRGMTNVPTIPINPGGMGGNGGGKAPKKKKSKAKASLNPPNPASAPQVTPDHLQRSLGNGNLGGSPISMGQLGHLGDPLGVGPPHQSILKSTLIQYTDISPNQSSGSSGNGYSPPSDPAPPITSANIGINSLGLPISTSGHLVQQQQLLHSNHQQQNHPTLPTTSHQGVVASNFHPYQSMSQPQQSMIGQQHQAGVSQESSIHQQQHQTQQQQQQQPHQQNNYHHQQQVTQPHLGSNYVSPSVLHIVSPIGGVTPANQNHQLPPSLLTPNPSPFFSPGPSPNGPTPTSVINGIRQGSCVPLPGATFPQSQAQTIVPQQVAMADAGQLTAVNGNGHNTAAQLSQFLQPGDYMPNVDFMLQQGLGTPSSMTSTANNNQYFQSSASQSAMEGSYIVKVLPFTEW